MYDTYFFFIYKKLLLFIIKQFLNFFFLFIKKDKGCFIGSGSTRRCPVKNGPRSSPAHYIHLTATSLFSRHFASAQKSQTTNGLMKLPYNPSTIRSETVKMRGKKKLKKNRYFSVICLVPEKMQEN